MAPGSTSKLVKANPNSSSLQAVIPKGVVDQMSWKDGDFLDWEITFVESQKVVIVRGLGLRIHEPKAAKQA